MNRNYFVIIIFIVTILARSVSSTADQSLQGTVSPEKSTVGATVTYTLKISGFDPSSVKITPPEKKIAFPEQKPVDKKSEKGSDRELRESAVPLYVISSAKRDDGESGGVNNIIVTLTLIYYRTGVHTLPEIKITGADGKSIGYKVPTVTIEELNGDGNFEEIEPPVSLSGNYYRIIWVVVALLVACAAGVFLFRYLKNRKKPDVSAPAVPPIDIFLAEVDSLKLRELIESGRINEYVFDISIIFRRFLSATLRFDAAEMTTDEISSAIKKYMPAEIYSLYGGEIIDNMRLWDYSKFAEFTPSVELLLRNLDATVATAKKISLQQNVQEGADGNIRI